MLAPPIPIYLAIMKETVPVDPKHFEPVAKAAATMQEELTWWADVLRAGRQR